MGFLCVCRKELLGYWGAFRFKEEPSSNRGTITWHLGYLKETLGSTLYLTCFLPISLIYLLIISPLSWASLSAPSQVLFNLMPALWARKVYPGASQTPSCISPWICMTFSETDTEWMNNSLEILLCPTCDICYLSKCDEARPYWCWEGQEVSQILQFTLHLGGFIFYLICWSLISLDSAAAFLKVSSLWGIREEWVTTERVSPGQTGCLGSHWLFIWLHFLKIKAHNHLRAFISWKSFPLLKRPSE